MPDAIFSDPRLAEIYDFVDADRSDLDVYLSIVAEFGARSVLDVGCGTGTFACLVTQQGIAVTGVDPAAASLDVARRKPGADRVRWLHGDATTLPALAVDLVTMTGNVAQVFVTDDAWLSTLQGIRGALRPGGRLVFEVRDPTKEAWREWNRATSYKGVDIPRGSTVEAWVEVTELRGQLVSFRQTFVFTEDGTVLTSDSTLRFRGPDEIVTALRSTGYVVDEIRDAPDRPGRELVFVARAAVSPPGEP